MPFANTVFLEFEFFSLIAFSLVFPCAIYWVLLRRASISRYSVIGLAVLLIVMSGIDVYLLQSLADMTKATASLLDDRVFSSELSVALYILPAVFAGVGVNLLSHVLIDHLHKAESRHARTARDKAPPGSRSGPPA